MRRFPDDGVRAGSERLWAVLRYRLYGPGPHRHPRLAYALLMVLLDGGDRVVLRPSQLLGQDFSLVVAGATLAVTAVFQLARRRIQRVVDRRFNRRRYDAGQTTSPWLESERIPSPKENR